MTYEEICEELFALDHILGPTSHRPWVEELTQTAESLRAEAEEFEEGGEPELAAALREEADDIITEVADIEAAAAECFRDDDDATR
jgi:hypothetical protein